MSYTISRRRWLIIDKPHLYKQGAVWYCKLGIYSQTGPTIRDAYYNRMKDEHK